MGYTRINKFLHYFLVLLLISQLFFSRSVSLIIGVPAAILLIYYFLNGKLTVKNIILIIFIFLLFLLVVLLSLGQRLQTISSGEDGSAAERVAVFSESILLFLESPLIGMGFGFTRGMDLFSFILASHGIIGFIIISILFYKFFSIKNNNIYAFFLKCALLILIITSSITNNVLDHIFFWVIASIYSSINSIKKYVS
jgi:O-antigen ligase